ncbi:MAG: hemerythrin family protein [Planctomycetes bacterium]|nr:hemerythrin family protein [Planctomycetota bacterium]MCB9870937.1 hemerythrin family protein [Planctomycetota bacterium]MCB9888301.1 hemerythrin family protein [Planctomycetota bacterium]
MGEAAFFVWDPNTLSVHVDSMDGEHQKLIKMMNGLHERHVAGDADRAELARLLDEFAAFVVEHFTHEERYMASIDYPDLGKHKKVHENLLERFATMRQEFDAGDGTLPDSLFQFLKFWLSAHIRGVDAKYGHHAPVR